MQQATSAHSGACTGTSPENVTEFPTPTRRALLGFAAGVGALALATPVAAKLPQVQRWEALRVRWENAAKTAEEYYDRTYKPALKRLEAFTGKCPPLHFDITAASGQSVRHKVHPRQRSPFSVPQWNQQHDEMADAFDLWMRRSAEAEAMHGWQAISATMDDLDSREYLARNAMVNEPAPHAKALALKVQLALGNDDLWDGDRAAILADAARMA